MALVQLTQDKWIRCLALVELTQDKWTCGSSLVELTQDKWTRRLALVELTQDKWIRRLALVELTQDKWIRRLALVTEKNRASEIPLTDTIYLYYLERLLILIAPWRPPMVMLSPSLISPLSIISLNSSSICF